LLQAAGATTIAHALASRVLGRRGRRRCVSRGHSVDDHPVLLSSYDYDLALARARAVAVCAPFVAEFVLLCATDCVTLDMLPAVAAPLVAEPPFADTAPPAPPVPPVTVPLDALPPEALPLSTAPMPALPPLPLLAAIASDELPPVLPDEPPQPAHETPPVPPAPPAALPPVAVLPPAFPPAALPDVIPPVVASPLEALPVEFVAVLVPPAAEPVVRVEVESPVVASPLFLALPLVGLVSLSPVFGVTALPPSAPLAEPVLPPLPDEGSPAVAPPVAVPRPMLVALP
jgi:hypothetical protein